MGSLIKEFWENNVTNEFPENKENDEIRKAFNEANFEIEKLSKILEKITKKGNNKNRKNIDVDRENLEDRENIDVDRENIEDRDLKSKGNERI